MLRLTYRPAAIADLEAIYNFIAAENSARALSFVRDIEKSCSTLPAFPQLGPARDDLSKGIRIYPLRARVVVAYRVTPDAIVITRIFYGGQDYEAILRDGTQF
jgi:toxin ParE1/3/4